MKMTLEQRARRRATRKNNQLRRTCPLFADQFATTVEKEMAELERQDRQADEYLRRIDRVRCEMVVEEETLREQVQALAGDAMAALDRRRAIYPPEPQYGLDFWRKLLARIQSGESARAIVDAWEAELAQIRSRRDRLSERFLPPEVLYEQSQDEGERAG